MIEGARLFKEEFREEARKEFADRLAEAENRLAELKNRLAEAENRLAKFGNIPVRMPIKMLQKGYSIEEIVDILGLSEDEVNELKASLTAAA